MPSKIIFLFIKGEIIFDVILWGVRFSNSIYGSYVVNPNNADLFINKLIQSICTIHKGDCWRIMEPIIENNITTKTEVNWNVINFLIES